MLNKLKNKRFVLAILLVLSLAGFLFRLLRLQWPLLPLTLLAGVFAALTARQFEARPGFADNNRPSPALLLPLPAALLMAAASVIRLLRLFGWQRWLIGAGGLLGALFLGAIAVECICRRTPSSFLYMGLTVSLICRVIPEFRAWSADPMIGDYCFRLFALLAMTLTAIHLGGFALETGKRQLTLFYCILGVFLCAVSIADGGIADVLSDVSYLLFLLSALWTLMLPTRRRKKPAADGAV